jgi:hypothetical protein
VRDCTPLHVAEPGKRDETGYRCILIDNDVLANDGTKGIEWLGEHDDRANDVELSDARISWAGSPLFSKSIDISVHLDYS